MRRHGQDDDGDAGLVGGADSAWLDARPAAVARLLRHEVLDNSGVPVFPILAAHLVHGVGGVIVAVIEMDRAVEVVLEVLDAFGDLLGLVLAGEEEDGGQRQAQGRGAGAAVGGADW